MKNINKMNKKEIDKFIKEKYDVDLDRRKNLKDMREEAQQIIDAVKKREKEFEETVVEKTKAPKIPETPVTVNTKPKDEICPRCGADMVMTDNVAAHPTGARYKTFQCPVCRHGITYM